MNPFHLRPALIISILLLLSHTIYAQDTTIVIENCLKKTIVTKGNSTRTQNELLDCFWETGTDTLVVIEDCLHKTQISKEGFIRTTTKQLDCYWDDAIITKKSYLIYTASREECSYNFEKTYSKNGKTLEKGKFGSLDGYNTRRLGLDKYATDTIFPDANLEKKILLAIEQNFAKQSINDTIIIVKDVLQAVNDLRAKGCQCGDNYMPPVGPVKWGKELEVIAFSHAKDMYQRKYFTHDSPEGKSPFDRMDAFGLDYGYAGENIHKGSYSGPEAVYHWEKSPGHCKNMMHPNMKYVGVGRYVDKFCMLLSGHYSMKKK